MVVVASSNCGNEIAVIVTIMAIVVMLVPLLVRLPLAIS